MSKLIKLTVLFYILLLIGWVMLLIADDQIYSLPPNNNYDEPIFDKVEGESIITNLIMEGL